jgi:hypothetical protein
MAIRSLHGLSANFTLTPRLFKPPRYGPDLNSDKITLQSFKIKTTNLQAI